MVSLGITAAAWWLHGAAYLLYLLPLAVLAAGWFYLRAKASPGGETATEQGRSFTFALYALGALPALLWFTFSLRGMPDALKLRPSDSPAPQSTFAEVLADLKLHPEGWLLFGPVLALLAFAIARVIIARGRVGEN